ncbi:hypothetical protein [Bacillus pseudomycoides]|uniref:hypothetical protein n=1 Tax=Bacillus pseudomycoides TaxID=64104 RepID=UPI003D1EBB6A
MKRQDGLYTTEVYRWMEDCGYEFWSFVSQGFSLIDSEGLTREQAVKKLKGCSTESINQR